ncbi:unnamed protein product, partial [Didymodactylos carnosus]
TTTTMKSSTSLSSSKKQPARQQQLLDDNKKWGDGVGRMTTSMVDKLSTSYGIAIRQASSLSYVLGKPVNEALDIMQQYGKAAFYRYIKTNDYDEDKQHKFCPKNSDTWCSYQQVSFIFDSLTLD